MTSTIYGNILIFEGALDLIIKGYKNGDQNEDIEVKVQMFYRVKPKEPSHSCGKKKWDCFDVHVGYKLTYTDDKIENVELSSYLSKIQSSKLKRSTAVSGRRLLQADGPGSS